jgi:hypothetical protein
MYNCIVPVILLSGMLLLREMHAAAADARDGVHVLHVLK